MNVAFGKSYGAKKFVINRWIKKKEQFLYLRRYQVELDKVFQKDSSGKDFFSDVRKEFPKVELKTKGHTFICDNEIFGYAYRYTEAQDLKSSAGFENINDNTNELTGDIKAVEQMLADLSSSNGNIVNSVTQLSATTEEVTASAQQAREISEDNKVEADRAKGALENVIQISHELDQYMG